ncbi:MAG TPA: lysophospholipid acyltransferase family protein [Candidatus Binatia bacterium]|nr:lysophospholipid acyltransferase family protein [Candidatus Binatia bacterium]
MWNVLSLLDYFLILPVLSLFPVPLAYQLARLRGRWHTWWNPSCAARASLHSKALLGGENTTAGRYWEIVSCDEIDAYLFLGKPFRRIAKFIRVEGEEYLQEMRRHGKGVVLLSAHLGGALLSNPFLRTLGLTPQYIMRPVGRDEFPGVLPALYLYFRFRTWCATRAVGAPPLLSGRGVEEAVEAVRRGTWLWVALDVPPQFAGRTKRAEFFGRPARFPYGAFLIAARAEAPILPFFTSVDHNNRRTFRFLRPIWPPTTPQATEEAFHHCVRLLEQEIRARPDQWFFWEGAGVFFEGPLPECNQ